MNIMERRKSDIFSAFVFNKLMNLNANFHPFYFMAMASEDRLSILVSVI